MRLLHWVFAAASILMLIATVWMFAEDHLREWKSYQRTANDIEIRMAEWRKHQFQTDEALGEYEQLQQQMATVLSEGLDMDLVQQFWALVAEDAERRGASFDFGEFDHDCDTLKEAMSQVPGDEKDVEKASAKTQAARHALVDRMRAIVTEARFREAAKQDKRRFKSADLDEAKANVGLGVRDAVSKTEMDRRQAIVDSRREELQQLTLEFQKLNAHRTAIEGILKRLTAREDEFRKTIADNLAELERLEQTTIERRSTYFNVDSGFPLPGKKLLELPFFDAFNSPRKIENLWSEGLTQDYGFRDVSRFDRCATCHQAIQKTVAGSTTELAYPEEQILRFELFPIAEDQAEDTDDDTGGPANRLVEQIYGLAIAADGLITQDDVVITYVRAGSLADGAELAREDAPMKTSDEILDGLLGPAGSGSDPNVRPGLLMGDVLLEIDGDGVEGHDGAMAQLLDAATDAKRLKREGKENDIQPLMLTVRRGLPHPYASHPRLDLFVGSLSPHKMSDFACTICHEGQGSATAFKWASHTPNSELDRKRWRDGYGWFDNGNWDYPMHPTRFAESSCLKCHHDVVDLLPSERYSDDPAPKLVRGYDLVRKHGCFGCHEIRGFQGGKRIGPDLRAEPNPGGLRKVGPSLRHVIHKTGKTLLYDWISDPPHVQPNTRMPRFFGVWNHLDGKGRRVAEGYEPVEIRGIVTYLESRSEPFEYLDAPENITQSTPQEKAERGRILFQTHGCLVCHDHKDFPDAAAFRERDEIVEGPDVSSIADKIQDENSRKWLYSWIKKPTLHDPRTVMPDSLLEPVEHKDENGTIVAVTDPVDDLIEYLLQNSNTGYQPAEASPLDSRQLDSLVLEHLRDAFHEVKAIQYVKNGIPERIRDTLKAAENELVVSDEDFAGGALLSEQQKLLYIGRKTILKFGCNGCHDVPGFEDAKSIGTGLADWGRKDTGQLAFEHIVQYLQGHEASDRSDIGQTASAGTERQHGPREMPSDYYMHQILSGNRIGFAYQKLTEPRSYDYHVVENKDYNDRLRMPQFPFSLEDREAIITFLLGLVAKPPTHKYVYQPDPRRKAIIDGRKVLEEYKCGGCHMQEPEKWHIAFPSDFFNEQRRQPNYPFADHQFTSDELQRSGLPDRRGLLHATLVGMPVIADDGRPMVFDDYGDELFEDEEYEPSLLEYAFQLWRPVVLGGHGYQVGESPLSVPARLIVKKSPSDGGFLATYLLPHVVKAEKAVNPNVKGSQAWGWLPPPLLREGAMVQSDWLHDYLLDPHTIRPAALLRMPRFNMSTEEATKLANYFAVASHADYPYEFSERRRAGHLADAEMDYQRRLKEVSAADDSISGTRLDAAMRVVTDKNYCITCHIIGDFEAVTSDRAKGPDLAKIHKRMRADYLRRWLAKPVSVLPYTGMPVNIPYDPAKEHQGGIDQNLYHGNSTEQLDGLIDLFMNFDAYAKGRNSVTALVKAAAENRAKAQPDAGPAPK